MRNSDCARRAETKVQHCLPADMTEQDLIRRTLAVARRARANGNHPFGALLADPEGAVILEAENTVVTEHDCTAHAEMNLIRAAPRTPLRNLAGYTMYASTEPCPMCACAAYWSGLERIVYGLSTKRLHELASPGGDDGMLLSCRDVLAHGRRHVAVVGPMLENEAAQVHQDFWG
jgi:tRNA(Arg) A34 adenosine deaminase TadA